MTFNELKFEDRVFVMQARVTFANGYGASIVQGPYTYGGSEGLYELAVLKNDELCYDTSITEDVLGYLTPTEVVEYLGMIEALPSESVSS